MHDHATDGGRQTFESKSSARALRLHLDNAHNLMTSGLAHDDLAELHRKAHKDAQLAEIAAATDDEGADRLYLDLKGAREKLCQAQTLISDCGALGRHARGNLGRAIDLIDAVGAEWCDQWSRFDQPAEPPTVVDLMEALEESLAKAKRTLGIKASEAIPSEAPAGGSGPAADPLPAPPVSEEAEPRPAGRTASSGSSRSGGAS